MFLIFGRANIAPRYAINKIKKISLGRFFKIFLIVYSRIRPACLWAMPTKTAFLYGACAPITALWRIRLGRFCKIKKSGFTRFVYFGSPNRSRTGVLALKGRCPRPLDDGAKTASFCSNAGKLYMDFDPLSRKYTLFIQIQNPPQVHLCQIHQAILQPE